ncbi:MAG TPA: hypothetical protein VNA69_03795 [Thermoanaerobaculia bacterium]|nr:hypothetical protein [Thermoanaerobaculia bacterium]
MLFSVLLFIAVRLLPSYPPPPARTAISAGDPVIHLRIEYDEHLVRQHGERVEEFIREVVAIHSHEWHRYRRESFVIEEMVLRASDGERDASWMLASLVHRTRAEPDTLHVRLVGQPIEVYSNGAATVIGGLAFRGSDAVLVSSTPGVTADLAAYYLFHEVGHCWDAHDIPFGGGNSTFGDKSQMTFHIDAGNAEVIEESDGPRPRDTPDRAPAILRRRLFEARALGLDGATYARLHDLMLHEPSPANPAYAAKKRDLLAASGTRASHIEMFLRRYEITPRDLRHDRTIRAQIAEHYWRANDALREGDDAAAERELAAIAALDDRSPDVRFLVAAVERKIRRRR